MISILNYRTISVRWQLGCWWCSEARQPIIDQLQLDNCPPKLRDEQQANSYLLSGTIGKRTVYSWLYLLPTEHCVASTRAFSVLASKEYSLD